MKILKSIISGLWLSAPVPGFILFQLFSETEGEWLLIGFVYLAIFGFPWNIFVACPIVFLCYHIYSALSAHIEFFPPIGLNAIHLLYLWIAISGVVGTHMNGILILNTLSGKKS